MLFMSVNDGKFFSKLLLMIAVLQFIIKVLVGVTARWKLLLCLYKVSFLWGLIMGSFIGHVKE